MPNPRKPRFEIHADTRLLYQRLTGTAPGQLVSFAELSAAISRPVAGDCYNLQSALRMARRDAGILFSNVHGQGYRRMTDTDIVISGENDIARLRRATRRSMERQMMADASALPPDQRLKQLSTMAVLGALHQFSSRKALTAVTKAVTATGRELPLAETLKLFSKSQEHHS